MKINTPGQGVIDGWLLAENTDIHTLAKSDDGTIYASVIRDGTDYYLFRSDNGGRGWVASEQLNEKVIDICTCGNYVIYTDGISVYVTDSDMNDHTAFAYVPGTNTDENILVRTIDAYNNGDSMFVLAGTDDSDVGEYGNLYYLEYPDETSEWQDTGLQGRDIHKISVVSQGTGAGTIQVVVSDEISTFISIATKIDGVWNEYSGTALTGIVPELADITVSKADPTVLYLALTGKNTPGDVFRVSLEDDVCSVVDLNAGSISGYPDIDIQCIEIGLKNGTEYLYAGLAIHGDVYRSDDNGVTWVASVKRPSGGQVTGLLVDENFATNGCVFTATSGYGSGLSVSEDFGATYNQISLIDTDVSAGSILDMEVAPENETDTTIFLVTFDSHKLETNIWRSTDGGNTWERTHSGTACGMASTRYVTVSPEYGKSGNVIYLTGIQDGDPVVWRSTDKGQTFTSYTVTCEADALSVIDNNTLFVGSCDGTSSIIYRSDNGGQSWSSGVTVGPNMITHIECSPCFDDDGILLAGGLGWVYYSDDSGDSFSPLTIDSTSPTFEGYMSVAFDPGFQQNKIVYAGSSAGGEGLFRYVMDGNSDWQQIDAQLPDDAGITGIHVSEAGVLYAVNCAAVDPDGSGGGVERSLNPSFHLSPTFQTMDKGLEAGIHLDHLVVTGNRLWSLDGDNNWLQTYYDSMVLPVSLKVPADDYPGMETHNCLLNWNPVDGATEYQWQVDYTGHFSTVPYGFQGYTSASSVRLPQLETNTEYHWRVRVTKPVLSDWSHSRTFTTTLGQLLICPDLLSPGAGAEVTSREPVFQWSAIAGAEKYELLVSPDIVFSEPVIEKAGTAALPVTAWQSDITLDEQQTYYWKVRALSSGTNTNWSAVSVFVTPADDTEEVVNPPVPSVGFAIGPAPLSPAAGSERVAVQPLFQWEPVAGAAGYELVVSPDISFENPVVMRAGEYSLPETAWLCNIALDPGSVYYWKIRAVTDGGYTDWSSVGIFSVQPEVITGEEPDPVTESIEPPVPVIIQQPSVDGGQDFPPWIVYAGFGLLLVMVLLQIAVLLVVIITRTNRNE